jgi:hypothetical protein
MIIIDNAGFQFIDGANESALFKKAGVKINFFDFDTSKEGDDYLKEIIKVKRAYNKTANTICFKQNFTSDFLRKANEHLQACIDHRRIWFSSKTVAHEPSFLKYSNARVKMNLINENNILDFIESQDSLVYQTKKQCTLVEVKSTAKGTQTFDLPLHLRRSTSQFRARKDNYTTLMLACWATKCYFDLKHVKSSGEDTFTPFVIT